MTELIIAFLFGTIIGSFLNVCIYRIPKGESVIFPPSHCPNCKTPIKWHDNIPIISYLLLKGKCRNCGSPISKQYPTVELTTGLLTSLLVYKFGTSLSTIYYAVFTYSLIVISLIDLKTMLVPVKLCYFTMLLGILLSPFIPQITFKDSLLGASFGAGIILFIIETYYILTGKEGMGYGDANIMAVVGAFLGWEKVLVTLFLSSLIGSILGIIYTKVKKGNLKTAIPFGPFISLGAVATLFFGNKIINWYLGGLFK